MRLVAPPTKFAPDDHFEADFHGMRFAGVRSNLVDWFVYFFGAYEPEILMLIADILRARSEPVFFDVGANVGQHTMFASRLATVHAFEPYEPVRKRLEGHVRTNAISSVTVHPFGLGSRTQDVPFYQPGLENLGAGSFVQGHAATNRDPILLRVVRGDEFARDIDRIDLIKIDVEGMEGEVLSGLVETIRRLRPNVLFEFSHTTRKAIPALEDLRALFPEDYELLGVEVRTPRFFFFEKSEYRLRILRNTHDAPLMLLARPR